MSADIIVILLSKFSALIARHEMNNYYTTVAPESS